jgi:NitT/TauT family transport system substrate-binding protein
MSKKILTLLVVLTVLVSCGKPKPDQTLVLGAFKGPTGLSLVDIMENKPVLSGGWKVEVVLDTAPDAMLVRLSKGEVQAAALPSNLAPIIAAKGLDYQIAAVVGEGALYILGKDGVSSLKDLQGKVLYNSGKGATPQFMLEYLLKKEGVSGVDVHYEMAHAEIAQSLIAGKIDYALLPEPFATKALLAAKDLKVLIDLQEAYKSASGQSESYPLTVVVVKKSWADANPKTYKALLAAYSKSVSFALDKQKETAALAVKYELGFTEAQALAAIPRCALVFKTAKEAKPALTDYYNLLYSFDPKSIGGKLPDENLYRN